MPTEYSVADTAGPKDLELLVRVALASDEPLLFRLFVNDLIPSLGTVLASYVEASFTGYTERVINRADWGVATIDDSHVSRIKLTAGPQVYIATGALQTVYGCYLVQPTLGIVRYARRFTTPRVLVLNQTLRVNPIITLRSESYEVLP